MKTIASSKIAALALTLVSTFTATAAFADYHVSAFSETIGFQALLDKDIVEIEETFAALDKEEMDFFEANNLCVAQIVLKEFEAAIESCSYALAEFDYSTELTFTGEKKAQAAIYSNLAIAKILTGDSAGASVALETSLSLNRSDVNASMNYELIKTNIIAGD